MTPWYSGSGVELSKLGCSCRKKLSVNPSAAAAPLAAPAAQTAAPDEPARKAASRRPVLSTTWCSG